MNRCDDPTGVFRQAAASAGVELVERSFVKCQRLFGADADIGGIHVVQSGLIASKVLLENGREVLIGLHGQGETLGDLEYCMGGPAVCSVTALEPSSTLWADTASLDRMAARDPGLAMTLARILATRLHRTSQRLSAGVAYPLEYGLLKALLLRFDMPRTDRPLSKRDLFDYLGRTERHVNRILRDLEAAGVLHVEDGMVIVVDPALARRRLEEFEA